MRFTKVCFTKKKKLSHTYELHVLIVQPRHFLNAPAKMLIHKRQYECFHQQTILHSGGKIALSGKGHFFSGTDNQV